MEKKQTSKTETRFDPNKTWAIALGGGGAKGAYEIGVWRSLLEEGLKYNAVSGTSVGALNGAMMTMRDLARAETLWKSIRFSQVMDVSDEEMKKIYDKDVSVREFLPFLKKAFGVVKGGGFDVTPLKNLLNEYVDPKKIKNSDVDFIAVTYSLTDKKGVVIDMRRQPEEEICDMLLASAYFPAFKNEPLNDGKRYTDGGVTDSLPVTPLIERGYRDIIAVRLTGGLGREKSVPRRKDLDLIYVTPKRRLGSTLNFTPRQANYNMLLGYYDAKRMVYGYLGDYYYLRRTMTERDAYNELIFLLGLHLRPEGESASLRYIHESVLPKLAKEHGATGDYYDVLIRYLEHTGEVLEIPEFRVITDMQLLNEIKLALSKRGITTIAPKAFKTAE